MLSGNWKNFDELEENLSYPELTAMVQAQRARDERLMKFQAAIQGIDLDKDKREEEDPVEKIKRKVRASQAGISPDELKTRENAAAAGFPIIVE